MKHKTKQFITRHHFTVSNRLPLLRSRHFRVIWIRERVEQLEDSPANRSRGRRHWITARNNHKEDRVQRRSKCIITGRNRGVSGRYAVSRIQLKNLSNAGQLFGARKSSW